MVNKKQPVFEDRIGRLKTAFYSRLMKSENCKYSVVIPFYNEEENVVPVLQKVRSVMGALPGSYEIVAIDDGSSDKTFSVLQSSNGKDPLLKIIKFRRNFGQTQAMQAGIDHAHGDIIITMDGDLQNDPCDIPALLQKMTKDECGMVSGWRRKRKDNILRCIPSKLANYLLRYVTGVNIHDNGCSLKIYDAKYLKKIHLYSDMHRFISAFAFLCGAKVGELEVNHHPRTKGESKYGFSRIWKVLIDLFTLRLILHFSERPMAWFGGMSAFSLFTALLVMIFMAINGFSGIVWPGVLLLLVFNSLVLLGYGLICELSVRVRY